jgi:hypothetical protein
MTPLEDCYTLSTSTILDEAKVDEIVALGHSRIPVHTESDVNEFVGMLSEWMHCPVAVALAGSDPQLYFQLSRM